MIAMCVFAEDILDWFLSYADSFKSDDLQVHYNLVLKKDHTIRVCREITGIGTSIRLSDEDMRIAQITALLHDAGRFEQYTRYRTFSDAKSVNHAELAIAVINDTGVLKNLSEAARSLVLDAIRSHNLPMLPSGLPDRTALFAKLIRDADKLDILYLLAAHYRSPGAKSLNAVELTLPQKRELSAAAIAEVYRKNIVMFKDIHGADDFKILQMAWIFDLNFLWSLEQFRERGCLESLKEALPDTEEVRGLYEFTKKKLMEKLGNSK